MTSQEVRQQICRKYKRITGRAVGLDDTLKILTSPDLISDLKNLILEAEIEKGQYCDHLWVAGGVVSDWICEHCGERKDLE